MNIIKAREIFLKLQFEGFKTDKLIFSLMSYERGKEEGGGGGGERVQYIIEL